MILNPFTWFVSLREKILALVAMVLVSLAIGWHLHTVWDDYMDTSALKTELARAQALPSKLIGFQHNLKATNVQATPCYSTKLPTDVLKLLK